MDRTCNLKILQKAVKILQKAAKILQKAVEILLFTFWILQNSATTTVVSHA